MTKKATHADTTETQAQTAPAQVAQDAQTSAPTAAASATPVVPAAQAPAPRDEHTGKGGLYTVKDGVRRLVERTEPEQAQA